MSNPENGEIRMELSGRIDETFNTDLFNLNLPEKVYINMDRVHSINSVGIQDWILWMNSMSTKFIFLSHCQKAVIDQINNVEGFSPDNVQVMSFYVPYFNMDLNLEKNILIHSKDLNFSEPIEDQIKKTITDEKGDHLEIDIVVSKYFRFLSKYIKK